MICLNCGNERILNGDEPYGVAIDRDSIDVYGGNDNAYIECSGCESNSIKIKD